MFTPTFPATFGFRRGSCTLRHPQRFVIIATCAFLLAPAMGRAFARTRATAFLSAQTNVLSEGIWISPAEVSGRPTSGVAWDILNARAAAPCPEVDLTEQEQEAHLCVLAKALVFARIGQSNYRKEVAETLRALNDPALPIGRALALARQLPTFVIAADLIRLKNYDEALDSAFRTRIRSLLRVPTPAGPQDIITCHEKRPNNWGTHCGAARIAVAAYLQDSAELSRAAAVFRGWLGDRTSYSGFTYGSLSWQCDSSAPVGINPKGCTRDGNSLDGVVPDDQRRAGPYSWPPPRTNYAWEVMQGAILQAVILNRAGYAVFDWENKALLRVVQWLYSVAKFPAECDDTWILHLINFYYGTSFAAPIPSTPGKNMGWTEWTHPASAPSTNLAAHGACSASRRTNWKGGRAR